MKKLLILIALPVFWGLNTFAQTTNFLWAKQMGGVGDDISRSCTVDAAGNVYTTGYFSGTSDFDPGPGTYNMTSNGPSDIFISKLDASGNFLWAKQIGGNGSGTGIGQSIAVDGSGNVYTTGFFYGTDDFDPGAGTYNLTAAAGSYDIFVSKLDASGNFVWAKKMGGTSASSDDIGRSIAVDALGNVYTTGHFYDTVDFDPGPGTYNLTSAGYGDIFVSKLDASGNFVWAKQMGGASDDIGHSIAVDASGNVYTTGSFRGTADFDPGPGTYNLTFAGYEDIFVSKLDSSGNFVWAKRMGGASNADGQSIAVDISGNVYTTGSFLNGTVDFDPGPGTYNLTSAGFGDIFVSKLDASGNFVWAKNMGGASFAIGNSIAIDASGNVYTTGYFNGTADFDPGPGTYNLTPAGAGGSADIFVSKLDASGNFVWAKNMGGAYNNVGTSIAVDASGNVYTTGYFNGTSDFDPGPGTYNLTSFGMDDAFVVKLGQNIPTTIIYPKLFLSATSINGGQSITISGTDFTKNGKAKLNINGPNGFSFNNTLIATNNGSFSYSFVSNTSMSAGIYTVMATDSIIGTSSPEKSFQLKNPTTINYLKITSPVSITSSKVNRSLKIAWSDIPSHVSALIPNKSQVNAPYKIEYNKDNTGWQLIGIKSYSALYKQQSNFQYYYTPSQTGAYQFRITDMLDAANSDISAIVTVNNDVSGVIMNYAWDFSGNWPGIKPIGVAADGTARIYVKILKKAGNTKTISSVNITIRDSSNLSVTQLRLLGKLMKATDTSAYSTEANVANLTTVNSSTSGSGNIFWFWYVAPDDFVRNDDDTLSSHRFLNLVATVTYSDNSTDDVAEKVEIVRPPLMFVHGIGGDEHTWDNFYYKLKDIPIRIFFSGYNSSLWKISRALNMYPGGSYKQNAQLLLTLNYSGGFKLNADLTENYDKNSFQFFLQQMRNKGYSCNRVDYVAHSMGGDMARTAINYYATEYKPSISLPRKFKNYDSGFINKLITLNTPHNGSPWADLVIENLSQKSYVRKFLQVGNDYSSAAYLIRSCFNTIGGTNQLDFNNPTEALKNLRYGINGVKFQQSTVKNHLISGDLLIGGEDCLDAYNIIRHDQDLGLIYKLFAAIGGTSCIAIDQLFASYGINDFFENGDFVVPLRSELPDKNLSTSGDDYSIFYGINYNHLEICNSDKNPGVGQKVFDLLNAPINSVNFADNIAANNSAGSEVYKPVSVNSVSEYIDTNRIVIIEPLRDSTLTIDSSVVISVNLKDTANFKFLNLLFQNNIYTSTSKIDSQSFNVQINPLAINSQTIVATAVYDSSGTDIYYTDTLSVNVQSDPVINGFYITPKIKYLDSGQIYAPNYNLIHNTYISNVSISDTALHIVVADTNVVTYSTRLSNFVAKDTGTTYAVIAYKEFKDTIFFIIDTASINPDISLPVTLVSFNGYAKPTYNLLEWETASEINFSHFVLERSLNGSTWTEIATINSRSNSGTGITDYDYKDALISNDITFYRLLSVDIDGNYKISNTVLIRRSSDNSSIKVFPNPVTKSEVFIDLGSYNPSSKVVINVVDLSGKNIKTINQTIQNNSLIRLDLNGLKPSVYLLKIQKGNEMKTVKLVVLE